MNLLPAIIFLVGCFLAFATGTSWAVSYTHLLAASKGDPDAMKIVLQHFSGYIASLSMRKLYDERGNVYYGVDEDIRERLQARLMRAIFSFRP